MSKQINTEKTQKTLTIIGWVICAILLPILIINTTLLIKSVVNKDEVPSLGGKMPLIVLSDSMYPDIKEGDLIICKKIDQADIEIDDVIAFYDPESKGSAVVTHKVVDIISDNGKLYFKTKGINNNTEDRLAVAGDKVIGIYTGTRFGGIGSLAMFMQSTVGLIVCVILPIGAFVAYDVIKRKLKENNNDDEVEKLRAELEALKAKNAANESKE